MSDMGDGCKHLNNFKVVKGIQPYQTIHAFFVGRASLEARKSKVSSNNQEITCLQFKL